MKSRRTKMQKCPSVAYARIWRVVDGAVGDAFSAHPDYLTAHGALRARQSIVKRVTGALAGMQGLERVFVAPRQETERKSSVRSKGAAKPPQEAAQRPGSVANPTGEKA